MPLYIAGAPWSIKAFIGATSDALPLWGYHKRPYIVLSAFLGALASLCLAGFQFTPASASLVALLFFCGNFQVSYTLLLSLRMLHLAARPSTAMCFVISHIALSIKSTRPCYNFSPTLTQISLTDLLCEGKYAELMAANPHTGTDAVTWVWWCVMMGQLVGSVIVGPLADRGDFKTVFWVSVPLTAQVGG